MEKEKLLFGRVRVVLHPGSRVLKIAVTVLIVLSMLALVALGWVNASIQQRTRDMRDQAQALEGENQDLQNRIDNLGTLESIRQIARELLGLADPNTVIIETD